MVYTCDTSGNGLFYWSAFPGVPTFGGTQVTSRKDGTYDVNFDNGPGDQGQPAGSTETYMAPDYIDPGCATGGGGGGGGSGTGTGVEVALDVERRPERPSVPNSLNNHERRIRALERVPQGQRRIMSPVHNVPLLGRGRFVESGPDAGQDTLEPNQEPSPGNWSVEIDATRPNGIRVQNNGYTAGNYIYGWLPVDYGQFFIINAVWGFGPGYGCVSYDFAGPYDLSLPFQSSIPESRWVSAGTQCYSGDDAGFEIGRVGTGFTGGAIAGPFGITTLGDYGEPLTTFQLNCATGAFDLTSSGECGNGGPGLYAFRALPLSGNIDFSAIWFEAYS